MLFSCSKEEQELQQAPFSPSVFALGEDDYEIYDPMGDLEDEIIAALMHLEDDNGLGEVSINRGIWMLETGLNYIHGNLPHTHDSLYTLDVSFEFDRLEGDMLSEASIKEALIDWHGLIGDEEQTQYVKFASADVYFDEENSSFNTVFFRLLLSFFTGVVTEDGANNITLNLPPIPSGTVDLTAGTKNACYPLGPGYIYNAQIIANRAYSALPKFTGPQQGNWPFFTNIKTYSSTSGTSPWRQIDGSTLFGKSNSALAGQNTPQSIYTCLSIQEQNHYANAIYTAVNQVLRKDYGVIHINMEVNKTIGSNVPDCDWDFQIVSTGSNGWAMNDEPDFPFLQ